MESLTRPAKPYWWQLKDNTLKPGTERVWHKWDDGGQDVPVTVIEDRGAWVIVEAADGKHRVKRHNLRKPGMVWTG